MIKSSYNNMHNYVHNNDDNRNNTNMNRYIHNNDSIHNYNTIHNYKPNNGNIYTYHNIHNYINNNANIITCLSKLSLFVWLFWFCNNLLDFLIFVERNKYCKN